MKKTLIAILMLAVLGGGAYAAMLQGLLPPLPLPASSPPVAETEPTPKPTSLPVVRSGNQIIADGRVVPVQYADLSMATSGVVDAILVEEGQQVEENAVLIRLNNVRQKAAVAQAKAKLQAAQAKLDELQAGARPEELEAAQAAVEAAQAKLQRLSEGPTPEEIAAAQATLIAAQATLQRLLAGPDEADLIAAQAELANAQAARDAAQAAYDQVKWRTDIAMLPESVQLQQATNEYEAAKARYEALLRGPTDDEIASARAKVQQAQAELDKLRAPVSASEIAGAEAEVRRAQAEYDLLASGSRPEAVSAAQAEVAVAVAALMEAEAALAETELRAPFAGTVASIRVNVGEQVVAGEPIIQFADVSKWLIETADLTELNVVRLQVGDPVEITFDAIPGLVLPGVVSRIRSVGENKQGDIIYTVMVEPLEQDPRLRWNMTATVTIKPQE